MTSLALTSTPQQLTARLAPRREAHGALDPARFLFRFFCSSAATPAAVSAAASSPPRDQRPRPPPSRGQERRRALVRRVPVLAAQADPEAADVRESWRERGMNTV